jgi:exosortase/archaeosortase family protein
MADGTEKIVLGKEERFFSGPAFPLAILLCLMSAMAGIWEWYLVRVINSTDGFYGIFALIAILIVSIRAGGKKGPDSLILPVSAGLLFLFAATYDAFPPLLRGLTAFTALSVLVSWWCFGRLFHFGIWSLFVLSLPSIPSLQFFFGYPMRVLVGQITLFLLKLNGLLVVRDGVGLNFGEKTIWIDAPCSGIRMLWTGFFLTALLITFFRFNALRSILAFLITLGIIIVGNVFRATGLFYLEAEIVKMPDFAHEGVGVVSFILVSLGIVWALQKLRPEAKEQADERPATRPATVWIIVFMLASLSAIYVQVQRAERTPTSIRAEALEFPATFENRPLRELGLTEIEEYFMIDFPGVVKRFSDGEREIIIRFVQEATRKLHSPADCFAGNGYRILPLPLKIDGENNKWACFQAVKGEKKLKVCERIFAATGESWTDVSYWYWSALGAENANGYWAIAVAETARE